MATLQELLAQKEALERAIAERRTSEYQEGLDEIKAVMARRGLTLQDLMKAMSPGKAAKVPATTGKKVAVKYRDPATQQQWTGRGLQPKWLREKIEGGAKIVDFLVK